MNEILFLTQILFIAACAIGALKLGLTALTCWVVIQALIANLFVLKQITLFGFHVTASDAFAIGSLLGLNLMQEFFGQKEAKKTTFICFFFMVFFTVVSQLHLLFVPSLHDTSQEAFLTLFSPAPRLLIASMTAFFLVQQIDIYFFSFLQKRLPHVSFAHRTTCALLLSQFIDTCLFSFAGLSGLVASLADVILLSYSVKLLVIFSFNPILRWAKT